MMAAFPSDQTEAPLDNELVQLWGWGVFWVFGVLCAIPSYLLYWWNVNLDVIQSRLWIAGLVCAPSYLLACLGFVQAVSRVPCTRLRRAWPTLQSWRRLLVVSFTGAALCLLSLYAYFLSSLATTLHADAGAL
jgi:hypothetical protein